MLGITDAVELAKKVGSKNRGAAGALRMPEVF